MLKKQSSIPFCSTKEQDEKLNAVISAHKHDKSLLMAVMQKAQDIYGYLPIEVQNKIAEGMEVPLEKVYGVATFYAQFSLTPKGECHLNGGIHGAGGGTGRTQRSAVPINTSAPATSALWLSWSTPAPATPCVLPAAP